MPVSIRFSLLVAAIALAACGGSTPLKGGTSAGSGVTPTALAGSAAFPAVTLNAGSGATAPPHTLASPKKTARPMACR